MVRSFQGIEVTSRCNMACKYCPHPSMKRSKQDMTEETFSRVLYWLEHFQQSVVYLNVIGEPSLHPNLCNWIARTRQHVPHVSFSTNGLGVTRKMIADWKAAGLSNLAISIHRPEIVQQVIRFCQLVAMPFEVAAGPIKAHDWAGQVATPRILADRPLCTFLAREQAIVHADGRVVACCMDAFATSGEGLTVWDDLDNISFQPFSLCRGCHHRVPKKFPDWEQALDRDLKRPTRVTKSLAVVG